MRWLLSVILILIMIPAAYAQSNESPDSLPHRQHPLFDGALNTVAFNPNGDQLATGGRDNAVRLWDVDSGENIAILSGHSGWVTTLTYSPDGTVIASGGQDHNIWLWNTETATSLRLIEDHQAEVKAIAFTPDGRYMVSASLDSIIRIESLGNLASVQYFENYGGAVWSLAISPDGTAMAIGSNDGVIWLVGLWDESGAWLKQLIGHQTPVTSMAWSADGKSLLSGEQNGHIRLWNVTDVRQSTTPIESTILQGHLAPVMSVSFTSHESIATSTSLDGTVRLWDVGDAIQLGNELMTLYTTDTPLTDLSHNANTHTLAAVGTDGNLNLWSAEYDTLEAILETLRPLTPTQPPKSTPPAIVQQDNGNNSAHQPTPDVTTLPASSAPTLMIPSVGMQVGITTFPLDGVSWAIDPWEQLVGHLQGTAWVSGNGNIALGGHSVFPDGRAGIFNSLYNVSQGDEIIVQDGNVIKRYIVSDIRTVPYTDISVVYPTAHDRVTLITCDIPSFHAASGLYGDRLVVIADAIN